MTLLPGPTVSVSMALGRESILFARPAPAAELPVLEIRFGALVHALPAADLLRLFTAACCEHKLVLVSRYPSQLAAAAEALAALLWPLHWLNVYIPLLPVRVAGWAERPRAGLHTRLHTRGLSFTPAPSHPRLHTWAERPRAGLHIRVRLRTRPRIAA